MEAQLAPFGLVLSHNTASVVSFLSHIALQRSQAKKIKVDASSGSKTAAKEKDLATKPFFSVERSRDQVMCRTGLGGPGSSLKMPYGKGAKYASEAAAVKVAMVWVEKEKKRQGLK